MNDKFGYVRIADEVLLSIAAIAATDVKGVAGLSGGLKRDDVTKATQAQLLRAIRIVKSDAGLAVKVSVAVDGTGRLPVVTEAVQKKVKNSLETMTGNDVVSVDVTVDEVEL